MMLFKDFKLVNVKKQTNRHLTIPGVIWNEDRGASLGLKAKPSHSLKCFELFDAITNYLSKLGSLMFRIEQWL